MDTHPGWHTLLAVARQVAGLGADDLVVFSVAALFVWFVLPPVLMMRRAEAWAGALLVAAVTTELVPRLLLGRPYLLTAGFVVVFCMTWRRLRGRRPDWTVLVGLTGLAALCTWSHTVFFLLSLPIGACLLARQWRVAARLTAAVAVGVVVGAVLTGDPVVYLEQNIWHVQHALEGRLLPRQLVAEFQPDTGNFQFVAAVVLVLLWQRGYGLGMLRPPRGLPADASSSWRCRLDQPVFILGFVGWVLGFSVARFWLDWGLPAMLVWMAREFEAGLRRHVAPGGWPRLALTVALLAPLYLAVIADVGGRWTQRLTVETVDATAPEVQGWLPEPGGILYNDTMGLFYRLFYKNPRVEWRFAVGYEPAMMPADDRATLRAIQWQGFAGSAYRPWVEKLRPVDRLAVEARPSAPPPIPGVEWKYFATNTWLGRKRVQNTQ